MAHLHEPSRFAHALAGFVNTIADAKADKYLAPSDINITTASTIRESNLR